MPWLAAIPRALLRAGRRAGSEHFQRLAASIAYYALFSLPALLLVAIHLAGAIYGEEAARARLVTQVARHLGADVASTVESVIQGAASAGTDRLLPRALGVVALLFGASLTFRELQHGLNEIWGTTHARRWYVTLLLKRLLSFAMVLVTGAFLIASMAASVGMARFGSWLSEHLPPDVALGLLRWIEPAVALTALILLFVLFFKVLPDGHVPWKRAWVGAVVTAPVLVAAKSAVAAYIGVADVGSVYGAAGSLVVLLVWIYASCAVILLGGSFAFAWEEVRSPSPLRGQDGSPQRTQAAQ